MQGQRHRHQLHEACPGATVPRPGRSCDSIRVWGLPTNFCVVEVHAVFVRLVMAFDLEVMCDCCLDHTYAWATSSTTRDMIDGYKNALGVE
jgi:hypothetical protein